LLTLWQFFLPWNGFEVEDKISIKNGFQTVHRANGGGMQRPAAVDDEKGLEREAIRLGVKNVIRFNRSAQSNHLS